MQGFISKGFRKSFYNPSDSVVFEKITVELPDSPFTVAQARSHTLYLKNNARQ
jgi:hypothetical protein